MAVTNDQHGSSTGSSSLGAPPPAPTASDSATTGHNTAHATDPAPPPLRVRHVPTAPPSQAYVPIMRSFAENPMQNRVMEGFGNTPPRESDYNELHTAFFFGGCILWAGLLIWFCNDDNFSENSINATWYLWTTAVNDVTGVIKTLAGIGAAPLAWLGKILGGALGGMVGALFCVLAGGTPAMFALYSIGVLLYPFVTLYWGIICHRISTLPLYEAIAGSSSTLTRHLFYLLDQLILGLLLRYGAHKYTLTIHPYAQYVFLAHALWCTLGDLSPSSLLQAVTVDVSVATWGGDEVKKQMRENQERIELLEKRLEQEKRARVEAESRVEPRRRG